MRTEFSRRKLCENNLGGETDLKEVREEPWGDLGEGVPGEANGAQRCWVGPCLACWRYREETLWLEQSQ